VSDEIEPGEVRGEIEDFQRAQAERVRDFLRRLDVEDDLLRSYFNDRVTVLRKEVEDRRLFPEDVALLLDSNYSHIYDVMSKGSEARRWLVIWIV
jgi:hypothetical protein